MDEGSEAEEENDDGATKRKFPKDRPKVYGAIPGVDVGTVWQMRSDCSYDGIHRYGILYSLCSSEIKSCTLRVVVGSGLA